MANKLCALLSRSEIRDLVDVRELEIAGFSLENAFEVAKKKDTGLTPSQLAWVLNDIKFGNDLILPNKLSVAELRDYLQNLIAKITLSLLTAAHSHASASACPPTYFPA